MRASTGPFAPGRTDTSQENTDVDSFAVLEPRADGFRNHVPPRRKGPFGAAAAGTGVPAPDITHADSPFLN